MRDIDSAVAGARPEPIAPTLPNRAPPQAGPNSAVQTGGAPAGAVPPPPARIFAADVPAGNDVRGLDAALRPLAELVARRDSESPLAIAFLGGAGAGKSFALAALIDKIAALTRTAERAGFVRRIATVKVDAARLDGDACVPLAEIVYETLGAAFPEFVGSAADAVRDPRAVAREFAERLDTARRRLDAERQSLTESESRRARIFETVLFETAGSKVDAYARANRASIESRLEGFGVTGEPILNFKSMVRDLAEAGGPLARAGAAVRALWGFKGQVRLLVTAVLLVAVGLALGAAVANEAAWLGWLQGLNEKLAPVVDWARAHVDWLTTLQQVAYLGALLAVVLNVLRAVRFMQPLLRGVSLLQSDVAAKRRDIDALYAHQMRRVDHLTAEVERMARQAAEADRRAGDQGGWPDLQLEASPFDTGSLKMRAEKFFASLGRLLQRSEGTAPPPSEAAKPAPERIVVALDNLDALAPEAACAVLEASHRALAQPGLVLLLALDAARLSSGQGDLLARLEKWIQVPFRVGPDVAALDAKSLVAEITGRGGTKPAVAMPTGPVEWAVGEDEAALLAALAPVAGASPRGIKRFVNLYRVVRSQAPEFKTELALMLAIDLGGSEVERSSANLALAGPGGDIDPAQFGPSIAAALAEAGVREVRCAAARRAAAIVRCYSLRAACTA